MGVLNFFVNEKAVLEIMDLREIEEVVKFQYHYSVFLIDSSLV